MIYSKVSFNKISPAKINLKVIYILHVSFTITTGKPYNKLYKNHLCICVNPNHPTTITKDILNIISHRINNLSRK